MNTRPRRSVALVLALAAPALVLTPFGWGTGFQFTRTGVAAGEHWRWLTGHWVHVSHDHLLYDLLAFVVLGLLAARFGRPRFVACVFGSAVAIPVALHVARPQLDSYCGLSGIDSALFGLVVATLLWRAIAARAPLAIGMTALLAAGFVGKVGYECCTAATLFVDAAALDAVPEPLAHVVGFVVGLASADWRSPCCREATDSQRAMRYSM